MNPFGQGFPEPLQSVMNHAERFFVALTLAETDHDRTMATGPRELSLSETWIIGRAGEVESVVEDIIYDWRVAILSDKSAAAAIDFYLRAVHRGMRDRAGLGSPTCCSNAHECVTVDFCPSRDLIARSYPREVLAARMSTLVPPPMVPVRIEEASSPPAARGISRMAGTVEIRL